MNLDQKEQRINKMCNFYAFPLKSVYCIIILFIIIWTVLEWLLSNQRGKICLGWRYVNIVLCVFSLSLIVKMTLWGRTVGNREVELLPFYTIYTIPYNNEAIRTMVMNVVLFFPLGLTMPVVLGRLKNVKCKWLLCIVIGFVISASVEIIQYYFCIGRAETDDVICNTLGCLLGVMPNILADCLRKSCAEGPVSSSGWIRKPWNNHLYELNLLGFLIQLL